MVDFILQLHITGNCNLRCRHCYMDEHRNNMSLSDIKRVVTQFEELIRHLEQTGDCKIRAHIHFTGGEPLLHPQIDQILRFFIEKKDLFWFGIMSNGTLLKPKLLLLLKKLPLKAFQVSLDGDEAVHDGIRGKGNYRKVLKALDILHLFGISTRVSFTANQANYHLFPKIAQVCRRHHVRSLWSDRYIPFDPDSGVEALDKASMQHYAAILQKEKDNPKNIRSKLSVQNYRALQFLCSGENIYHCKAGQTMITVDEYGNIMPCRRLPIICGNIQKDTLLQIYENHPEFQRLRTHSLTGKCVQCPHAQQCKGGARCFTYALTGSYAQPDPCCWL